MPITDQQVAQWGRELAAIEARIAEERAELRDATAATRKSIAFLRERADNLLGLISGRTGEQLPLVATAQAETMADVAAAVAAEPQPEEWVVGKRDDGTWHLWHPNFSESHCGDVSCDDFDALPKMGAKEPLNPDYVCQTCAAAEVPAGEALRDARKRWGVCVVPGCGSAAPKKVGFCDEHASTLDAKEKKAIKARNKRLGQEAA